MLACSLNANDLLPRNPIAQACCRSTGKYPKECAVKCEAVIKLVTEEGTERGDFFGIRLFAHNVTTEPQHLMLIQP